VSKGTGLINTPCHQIRALIFCNSLGENPGRILSESNAKACGDLAEGGGEIDCSKGSYFAGNLIGNERSRVCAPGYAHLTSCSRSSQPVPAHLPSPLASSMPSKESPLLTADVTRTRMLRMGRRSLHSWQTQARLIQHEQSQKTRARLPRFATTSEHFPTSIYWGGSILYLPGLP
jgi:hypothetical protein